jgi:hypothetical protein
VTWLFWNTNRHRDGRQDLWQPRFPTPELVLAAADLLPSIREPSGRDAELAEGPRWEIVVSPGAVRVRTRDYARADRAHERAIRRHQAAVDVAVIYLREGDDVPEPGRNRLWCVARRARRVRRPAWSCGCRNYNSSARRAAALAAPSVSTGW